jgi:hypothetical protein
LEEYVEETTDLDKFEDAILPERLEEMADVMGTAAVAAAVKAKIEAKEEQEDSELAQLMTRLKEDFKERNKKESTTKKKKKKVKDEEEEEEEPPAKKAKTSKSASPEEEEYERIYDIYASHAKTNNDNLKEFLRYVIWIASNVVDVFPSRTVVVAVVLLTHSFWFSF